MVEYWGKDEVVTQSRQNAANRRGGNSDEPAPAMHMGGSHPHYVHMRVESTTELTPTHVKMYVKMHRSSDGIPCNAKADKIQVDFERKKEEVEALSQQDPSRPTSSDDDLFFTVLGELEKGRWTGAATAKSATSIHNKGKGAASAFDGPAIREIHPDVESRLLDKIAKRFEPLMMTAMEKLVGKFASNTSTPSHTRHEPSEGMMNGYGSGNGETMEATAAMEAAGLTGGDDIDMRIPEEDEDFLVDYQTNRNMDYPPDI